MSPRATEEPTSRAAAILPLGAIVGQDSVIATLRRSMARGTLHHALLFVGPEGVGKRTTALALARRLLCRAVQGDEACGVCGACVQVAAGSHPDFHREGFFFDDKKKEFRESMAIDQVRDVQAFVAGQALAGGRKVVLIEEAHALGEDAQNALLKTLEEPPRGSLLILVCHNASRLAVTVRSRCQRVAFAPLDTASIRSILAARGDLSGDDLERVARYADGSLALADEPDLLREADQRIATAVGAIRRKRYPDLAAAAKAILSAPRGVPIDLQLLVSQLRHRMRAAAGLASPLELTPRDKPATLAVALQAVDAAYVATADLGRYANRRLAVERMALRLARSLE